MTAIAGIVEDGKVWMGADSAGVGGLSLVIRSDPKVFKVGELLMGFCGSFRMGQLLRYFLTPPVPKESQDDFDYMVKEFVPAVREIMKGHGFLNIMNGVESLDGGSQFLIGRRGALYCIEQDMQVGQLATPYAATGCGQDLALGSLHTTHQMTGESRMKPRERIEAALKAAEAFSAGVRGPFIIDSI